MNYEISGPHQRLKTNSGRVELIPSYSENIDILDQHLQDDNDDDDNDLDEMPEIEPEVSDVAHTESRKRKREIFDEIGVRSDTPPWEKHYAINKKGFRGRKL